MKALVLGATGGCGAPCLLGLLDRGVEVTVIVRSADRLPAGNDENQPNPSIALEPYAASLPRCPPYRYRRLPRARRHKCKTRTLR